jgi:hypothetical protein
MGTPRTYPFRKLIKLLAQRDIQWDPGKGKGSHGCFVGPDADHEIQSYPIPYRQQRETARVYLKGICDRFGMNPDQLPW